MRKFRAGTIPKCKKDSPEFCKHAQNIVSEYYNKHYTGMLMGNKYCISMIPNRYPALAKLYGTVRGSVEGLFVAKEMDNGYAVIFYDSEGVIDILINAAANGKIDLS